MESSDDDGDRYTPELIRLWLRHEVGRVMKAAELQIKDATDLASSYAIGAISTEEAQERMSRYDKRWGEHPLISAMPSEDTPNETILHNLDKQRGEGMSRWSERKSGRASRFERS
jgi:hypothetical protein